MSYLLRIADCGLRIMGKKSESPFVGCFGNLARISSIAAMVLQLIFSSHVLAAGSDEELKSQNVLTPITIEYQSAYSNAFKIGKINPCETNCSPKVFVYQTVKPSWTVSLSGGGIWPDSYSTVEASGHASQTERYSINGCNISDYIGTYYQQCCGYGYVPYGGGWWDLGYYSYANILRDGDGLWHGTYEVDDLVYHVSGFVHTNFSAALNPLDSSSYIPANLDCSSSVNVNYVFGEGVTSLQQTVSVDYSDPFTTDMLTSQALSASYPNEWSIGSPTATLSLTPDERTCNTASKFKYRFKFVAELNQPFWFDYLVRFKPVNGAELVETRGRATGTGTGEEQYWEGGGDQEVNWNPLYYTTTTNGCSLVRSGTKTLEVPQICASCAGLCKAAGDFSAENGSVEIKASLGTDSYGKNSGSLILSRASPGAELFTPAALDYFGTLTNIEVIKTNAVIRQAKSQQALADIVTLSTTSYEIRFYQTYGGKNGSGQYQPSGTPFSKGKIEQIDSTNHLRLTVTDDASNSKVYDFQWLDANQAWTLTSGGGLRTDLHAWSPDGLSETNIVRDNTGAIVSQTVNNYYREPNTGSLFLKETVVGVMGELRTQFQYYDNTNDLANFGKVFLQIEPSGKWTRYEYGADGLPVREVSQFLNAPTNAADNLCRIIEHDYTSLAGAQYSERTVGKLLGQEISRRYLLRFLSETWDVQCQTPGALYNAPDNLVTVTKYISVGTDNLPASVKNPDGTMQTFQYTDSGGVRTTTTCTGQPNTAGTGIIAGIKTVDQSNSNGWSFVDAAYDIATGIVTAACTNYFDSYGRITNTVYLGGAKESKTYNCCGVGAETDQEGNVTTYDYDALKRPYSTTFNGITTLDSFDAEDRCISRKRVGTDLSVVVISSASFDTAGRPKASTNAAGTWIHYSYGTDANGMNVQTNQNADGGILIQRSYQDGYPYSLEGSAAQPKQWQYGVNASGAFVREIKVDVNGGTSEWEQTYIDVAGHEYKTSYPRPGGGMATSQNYFNTLGQMVQQVDPDGIVTSFRYNGEGEREYTTVADRVSRVVSDVTHDNGVDVIRSQNYATDDSGNLQLVSTLEDSVDGMQVWEFSFGRTNSTQTTYNGNGRRTEVSIAPDGTVTTSVYQGGLLRTNTVTTGSTIVSRTTYGYDAHGRQTTNSDLRNGATVVGFNSLDQAISTITPVPGTGQLAQTNSSQYDLMGQVWKTVLADGTSVTNAFTQRGEVQSKFGSRTYRKDYTYDSQGRKRTLTTYANPNSPAVTRWNYGAHRGWLASKDYADPVSGQAAQEGTSGPLYRYQPSGREAMRTWKRGIVTTYIYNQAGDLGTVSYSDGTGIVKTYDHQGRVKTVVENGTATTTFNYNAAGQVLTEVHTGGVLDGVTITNAYDSLLRRTNVATVGSQSGYSYDAASRLLSLKTGSSSATYTYLTNSSLVGMQTFAQSGINRLVVTQAYDFLNRLTNLVSAPAGTGQTPISFAYAYNLANQLTLATLADGSYWSYLYDELGQVSSSKRYWSDGTAVAGQQFKYTFDGIGNRLSTGVGGDASGAHLRSAKYTPNRLNQYWERGVPGAVDIVGDAATNATVTVNNQPTYRRGTYYRDELTFDNSRTPVLAAVTNLAVISPGGTNFDVVATNGGRVELPATPEKFFYDLDGNLTGDGLWGYTWDAENRLIRMEANATVPTGAKLRLDFANDFQGRRIQKVVSTNSLSGYVGQYTNKFVYDGWNLIAILGPDSRPLVTFTWGTDASGSIQGAGAVGGLISMTICSGSNAGTYFYFYDGSQNVAGLVNAANGTTVSRYEYGPFGELIRATGPLAFVNPFLFSTKYVDWETGFYYYGYRYFNPITGRWLSRDPSEEEQGGMNLYAFDYNSPINSMDLLGLKIEWHHFFPRAIFGDLAKTIIDIDAPQYGWMLDEGLHDDLHGIPGRWNDRWKLWRQGEEAAGRKITEKSMRKQLAKMLKDQYLRKYFSVGVRATVRHSAWGTLAPTLRAPIARRVMKLIRREAAKVAAKKASKQGIKSFPFVGWGVAVAFFACDMANPNVTFGEAVQSNIPYYGVAYDAKRVYDQIHNADAMIDAELTSAVYEKGNRSLSDLDNP